MLYDMCMQCAMGAMTAGAAATGMRAWLTAHTPDWASSPVARRAGRLLFASSFVLAGGLLGGTAD
jgi:hypothetical protein